MTLTRARYVAIREAGHLLPYEAPHRIIDELRAVVSAVGDRLRTVAARQDAGQPSSSESTSAHPFDRAGFS